MQNAEGMPVSTVQHILKNGERLAANLKAASGGDMRLEASRAAMFYEFGKTYQKIGHRDEAIKASDESLAIRRRLAAAHPQNLELAAGLAESLDLAGDLEREQKRYPEARALYSEAARTGLTLNAKDPANPDYAVSLSKTLIRLGDLDRLAKNFFEAKGRYRDAFEKIKGVLRGSTGEPPPRTAARTDLGLQQDRRCFRRPEGICGRGRGLQQRALRPRVSLFRRTRRTRGFSTIFPGVSARSRAPRCRRATFAGALDAAFASLSIRRKLVGERPQEPDLAPRYCRSPTSDRGDQGQGGRFLRGQDVLSCGGGSAPRLEEGGAGRRRFRRGPSASMAGAKEALAKRLEAGGAVDEPAFQEVVAEEEAHAAAKAGAQAPDPSVCWGTILASLRGGSANSAQRVAE